MFGKSSKEIIVIKSYINFPKTVEDILQQKIKNKKELIKYFKKIVIDVGIENNFYEHIKYHHYGIIRLFNEIDTIIIKQGKLFQCLPISTVAKMPSLIDTLLGDRYFDDKSDLNIINIKVATEYLINRLDKDVCYAKDLASNDGKYLRWVRSSEDEYTREKLPYIHLYQNSIAQDDDFGIFFTEADNILDYIGYGDLLAEIIYSEEHPLYKEILDQPFYQLNYTLSGKGYEYYSNKVIVGEIRDIRNPETLDYIWSVGGQRIKDLILGNLNGDIPIEDELRRYNSYKTADYLYELRKRHLNK